MSSRGTASDRQLMLPLGHAVHGDETGAGTRGVDAPVEGQDLLTCVLDPENLRRALHQVRRNKGAPGIDGRRGDHRGPHRTTHWPTIRASVGAGTYTPQPVRRVAIPKPGSGTRHLGVPVVLDRFIEQALLQVLQADWDPTFSEGSYGFRPKRSAHQAVAQAQADIRQGDTWVVDLDLEKFFDRVNHDVLLSRVRQRVPDRRVVALIHRFLTAGVFTREGMVEPTEEGTPQGSPLSPLLANLRLDDRDRELETRGHRFVRAAADWNIDVRSRQAGERGMASVTRFRARKRKRTVNTAKSAVARPGHRKVLGVPVTRTRPNRRKVSVKALAAFKANVRAVTGRTRGRTIHQIVAELRTLVRGWRAYCGFTEVPSPLRDLEGSGVGCGATTGSSGGVAATVSSGSGA